MRLLFKFSLILSMLLTSYVAHAEHGMHGISAKMAGEYNGAESCIGERNDCEQSDSCMGENGCPIHKGITDKDENREHKIENHQMMYENMNEQGEEREDAHERCGHGH